MKPRGRITGEGTLRLIKHHIHMYIHTYIHLYTQICMDLDYIYNSSGNSTYLPFLVIKEKIEV